MTFIQRRINVDATSWRCIDVEATLCKRHVLAGHMPDQIVIPHRCFCLFVLRFLRPGQSNWDISSWFILPNHTYTGQAYSSKRLTSICTFFRQKDSTQFRLGMRNSDKFKPTPIQHFSTLAQIL